MQPYAHYSISIHAASPITVAAQPSSTSHIDDPSTPLSCTRATYPSERYARTVEVNQSATSLPVASLPAVTPLQNGFKAIKDAARRDFFTIRADSVQDGVLSLLDSLAEYLVWDGMDRRLRAAASATHTDYPEAIVSVQQIANDIKIRVGHDLCERTIERALKKLCDVGLLTVTPRFHQGRRQASSYMLLYAPSMASRLENSRRGRINGASTGQEPPQDKPVTARNPDSRHYQPYGAVRIGDMIPGFRMSSGFADLPQDVKLAVSPENTHVQPASDLPVNNQDIGKKALSTVANAQSSGIFGTTVLNHAIEDVNRTTDDPEMQAESGVCRSAHCVVSTDTSFDKQVATSHPTSMSPLFNKEKENKKAFKNVFSISDFSKKNNEPKASLHHLGTNGYFLDEVHQKGWVSAEHPGLKPYLGDLSRYAFFNGHHTLEALCVWFQAAEDRIAEHRSTIAEILLEAEIQVSDVPASSMQNKMEKAHYGC